MSLGGVQINLGISLDGKHELTNNEKYGKIFPLLYDEKTRENAYKEIEDLFNKGFTEAGILLGQYYYQYDKYKAAKYYEAPAKFYSAEAFWGLASCIDHNFIPQNGNENDDKWIELVRMSAERGCPDAMNELGNIENRLNNYFLSAYWYGMAELYEHPQAIYGCKGIAEKWNNAGRPDISDEYKNNKLYVQGKLFIETDANENREEAFENVFKASTEEGYTAATLFTAKVNENDNNLASAFVCYQKAASEGDIYAKRACGDMLISGNGCNKNIEKAREYYNDAALKGEKNSCFVMGEFCRERNPYLANSWYAQASVRGLEIADERLKHSLHSEPKNKTTEQSKQKSFWRNSEGKIECSGDECIYENGDCGEDCPIYLNTKGIELISMKKYFDAINVYLKIIRIAEDFKDAWVNLAVSYGYNMEYKNAYNAYKKAYELDNNYKNAIYGLALSSKDMYKYDESISWCNLYEKLYNDGACAPIRNKVDQMKDSNLHFSYAEDKSEVNDVVRYMRETYKKDGGEAFFNKFYSCLKDNYKIKGDELLSVYKELRDIFAKLDEKYELEILDYFIGDGSSYGPSASANKIKEQLYKKHLFGGWHRKN